MGDIIVAIDFSEGTAALLSAAAKYARVMDGPSNVVLLHVAAPQAAYTMETDGLDVHTPPEIPRDTMAELLRARHEELRKLADELAGQGVHVQPVLVQGSADVMIIERAQRDEAQMIIIGSHGHGRLYDLIVGSVAHRVIRQAPCPVLVVPTRR